MIPANFKGIIPILSQESYSVIRTFAVRVGQEGEAELHLLPRGRLFGRGPLFWRENARVGCLPRQNSLRLLTELLFLFF